jgi:glutamyl-tRNA reductase
MEMAQIALVGLSHQTAPIAVREQMSCSVAALPSAFLDSREGGNDIAVDYTGGVCELVILSTCNRVEIYAAVERGVTNIRELLISLLSETTGVDTGTFNEHLYFHTGRQVANHLLRVSTGLESSVLGEPQILGQVTQAYMAAVKVKTIGPVLTELFRAAIRSGKRARTETRISHNPVSTSSLAIARAQKQVGDLKPYHCLIIGLGEMGRLAFKRLQARGVPHISLVNRTYERAADLARQHGQTAYRWEELGAALAKADIVISSTGATDPIINAGVVRAVMAARPQRPLILLDISVPRDIMPDVAQIENVHLWDADELKSNLDESLAARQQEVPKVEQIIVEEEEALLAQLRMLAVKPVIVTLREKAEGIRQHEMERMLHNLGEVDAKTMQQLQIFSRSLVNKLLHEPTILLKTKASHDEANPYITALNDLFDLEQDPVSEFESV